MQRKQENYPAFMTKATKVIKKEIGKKRVGMK